MATFIVSFHVDVDQMTITHSHTCTHPFTRQCSMRYTHLLSNPKVNEFSDNLQHIAFQKSCSIWHVSKIEERQNDAENLFCNLPFKFNYKIFTKYTCTEIFTLWLICLTHPKLSTSTRFTFSLAHSLNIKTFMCLMRSIFYFTFENRYINRKLNGNTYCIWKRKKDKKNAHSEKIKKNSEIADG